VIEARQRLTDDDAEAVAALVLAATKADGVGPLSEHGLLRLRGGTGMVHFVVRAAGIVVGYAQLDDGSGAAEVVVHPAHRRQGIGRELVTRLITEADGSELRIWAHGDAPAAAALAAAMGFQRVRSLWQMSRPLTDELPEPQMPAGIEVDTFVPGSDENAWITLNALAFADHPEQGAWTLADFNNRMAEPWFDPGGFFVARRGPAMVGFHWTKVHDESTGEVYVVGIDPAEQRRGLGKALTLVGMHHLRDVDVERVILYVDESNQSAVRLYAGLGFERVGVDVMYAQPTPTR
jgi:mycothiol synthase